MISVFVPTKLMYGTFVLFSDAIVMLDSRIEDFGGIVPKFANHLRTLGDARVVTLKSNKMHQAIKKQGTAGMLLWAIDPTQMVMRTSCIII